MSAIRQARATLADLYRIPEKAELIGGRIVRFMASGEKPSRAAFRIARSLDDHADRTGQGRAYADNTGFAIPELLSGRESFAPDASFYVGPLPVDRMRFIEGPPTFAAEVRSENDYGAAAEAEMADKRSRLLRGRHASRLGRRSRGRMHSRLPGLRSPSGDDLSSWPNRRSRPRRARMAR
jgi:Uma2 family endonuclease